VILSYRNYYRQVVQLTFMYYINLSFFIPFPTLQLVVLDQEQNLCNLT